MTTDKVIEVFRPVIYEDSIQAAAETLRSGWIGMGPRVKEFEEKFSSCSGARQCIAVNNGTSALHLAFKSLGLPAGSKVLVSDISYLSMVSTILQSGYVPVFADVESHTGNISVESAREKISENIKAIACTHIGGYPCDLAGLRELAASKGIPLVEDCAHAIGAAYRGKRLGDGTLCCYSFSFPKAITGIEGGAVLTSVDEYADNMRALRNLGLRDEASEPPMLAEPGYRYNWNDVMASIALKQMGHFEADNRRRAAIARRYAEGLENVPGIQLPYYESDRSSSYFFFPIFFDRRDALSKKLDDAGIRTKVYFRGFSEHYRGGAGLPNAGWYGAHELTLPLNMYMDDDDVERVISVIKEGW